MFKNSYGTSWGNNGFFYVPIGSNSFCTEHEAFFVFPKNVDVENFALL